MCVCGAIESAAETLIILFTCRRSVIYSICAQMWDALRRNNLFYNIFPKQ